MDGDNPPKVITVNNTSISKSALWNQFLWNTRTRNCYMGLFFLIFIFSKFLTLISIKNENKQTFIRKNSHTVWLSYFKAAQPHLKLHSPIQFHLSLIKGHSRSTKSLVTAWDLGWKRNWMHRKSHWWRAGKCLTRTPLISYCRPSKQIQWNETMAWADEKGNQAGIQGPAHALMWSALTTPHGYKRQIPSPIRQNRGKMLLISTQLLKVS